MDFLSAFGCKTFSDEVMCEHLPGELHERANYYQDVVRLRMDELRETCYALEVIVDSGEWPMPTYTGLLHKV